MLKLHSGPGKIFLAGIVSSLIIFTASITACGPTQYTLETAATGSGTVSVSPPGPHNSGTTATLTATPAAGYRFESWSGDAMGTDNPVTVTMDANKKVAANFIAQYTLTTSVNPEGAGTISPDQKVTDINTSLTVKATPAAGYKFDHWSGDLQGTAGESTVIMDGTKNITANFIKVQYAVAVTITPTDAGTVTPTSGAYDAGSSVTFSAVPKGGYVFDSWGGDVVGSTDHITLSVNQDKNITAKFKMTAPVVSPTPTVPATLTMDIQEAVNKGLVEVSGKGQSLFVIFLSFTSKSPDRLELTIPAGAVFDGPNDAISSMINISDFKVSLDPYQVISQKQVFVVTMDMLKAMPGNTTNLTLSKTPISGDMKLYIDCCAGPNVKIELKLALYGAWTITNNPARSEFHQIVAGTTAYLPSAQEWAQLKDIFVTAKIDTSKYKTFN